MCVCVCVSIAPVPTLSLCLSRNGNSGRLGLGPTNLKAVRTPTHVSYLTEKGMFVWGVACGAAHTAITTKIEARYAFLCVSWNVSSSCVLSVCLRCCLLGCDWQG